MNWYEFRDKYFPNTHRHYFPAIIAYAKYKDKPVYCICGNVLNSDSCCNFDEEI